MKTLVTLLVAVLALAACTDETPEERAARKAEKTARQIRKVEDLRSFMAACDNFGGIRQFEIDAYVGRSHRGPHVVCNNGFSLWMDQ